MVVGRKRKRSRWGRVEVLLGLKKEDEVDR